MKWVLSHVTDDLHHWILQQEDQTRSLLFHLQRLSLRLVGTSKRLFFLQAKGFLQKKIFLRSEYGVAIAETVFTDKPSNEQLLFNGQKFYYHTEDGKLLLFNHEKQLIGTSEMAVAATLDKYQFYSLLFGFTWFLLADTLAGKPYGLPLST